MIGLPPPPAPCQPLSPRQLRYEDDIAEAMMILLMVFIRAERCCHYAEEIATPRHAPPPHHAASCRCQLFTPLRHFMPPPLASQTADAPPLPRRDSAEATAATATVDAMKTLSRY